MSSSAVRSGWTVPRPPSPRAGGHSPASQLATSAALACEPSPPIARAWLASQGPSRIIAASARSSAAHAWAARSS
ncbi:MAG: hypothetical protein JWM19_3093 [Actinomycetia bacterium]|nr:hypothetical protein [Actinomycetes bacterium]